MRNSGDVGRGSRYFLRPGSDDALTLQHFTEFLVKKVKLDTKIDLAYLLSNEETAGG